ncbi:copper resistance protein CopD [Natrialbaceae archaeon A-CW2]|uniref:copper resistance protein CopD n=1 Tax=Natronosalvus amylolyticus TaxID=2961994 RepID=UPI0020C9D827|nr:copper resistance protein CopD [Natronosalvus amylolyticus]
MPVDAVSRIVHLVFAAVWAGSVFYVAFVVLPLARDGAFNTTKPLEVLSSKLTMLSRVSAVVLLVTGGHLAGVLYSFDGEGGPSLFSSTNGQLVIFMLVLWVALAALVEIGAKRFESGLNGKKLREPAQNALPMFRAAAVIGILLLIVGGLITTGFVHRL